MANTTNFLSFFVVSIAKQGFSHDIKFYATIFLMWLCNHKVKVPRRYGLGVLVQIRGSSISRGSQAVNEAVKQSTRQSRSQLGTQPLIEKIGIWHDQILRAFPVQRQ